MFTPQSEAERLKALAEAEARDQEQMLAMGFKPHPAHKPRAIVPPEDLPVEPTK